MRGTGFTVALLLGLWLALYVGVVLFFVNDDFDNSRFHPNWPGIVPVAIVAVASFVLWRRARTWEARPRWLIPGGAAVVTASMLVVFWPFQVTGSFFGEQTTCSAIADAWHPVVATPAAADLAIWRKAHGPVNFAPAPYTDPVRRNAFYKRELQARRDQFARLTATVAYQHADRYASWTFTRGVCVSTARNVLAASGGVLLLGTAILGVAVTRRRRAYLRGAAK